MFEAFSNDKSTFKKQLIFRIVIGLAFLFAAVFLNIMYYETASNNMQANEKIRQEAEWIAGFDMKEAAALEKKMLRPCKYQELKGVVKKQLDILSSSNLKLASVRNTENRQSQSQKGTKMKSMTTDVTVQGSWEDFSKAMNRFEKENLVVITKLKCEFRNGNVQAVLAFNTYYV